jgi:hypothetical protein
MSGHAAGGGTKRCSGACTAVRAHAVGRGGIIKGHERGRQVFQADPGIGGRRPVPAVRHPHQRRPAYLVDSPDYFARSREGDIIVYFMPQDDRAVTIRVSQIVSLEVANRPAA